jgi:hypothetical protein
MKSSNIKTFFTSNSILSKLNAYNTAYTVFTMDCKHDDSKHQSIIKFTEYQRKLWTLYALDTKEAVINHVALVNMARKHSLLTWNEKILQQSKPLQQVEALHQQKVIAKNNSFISSYSKKLFETTGLNATHSEIENDNKIIMVCIAAFALAILNFWIVYYD